MVSVESLYKDRNTKDPYEATDEYIGAKMSKLTKVIKKAEGEPFLRLKGCPVSVAEQLAALAIVGGLVRVVYDKTGARGRAAAALFAVEHRLTEFI